MLARHRRFKSFFYKVRLADSLKTRVRVAPVVPEKGLERYSEPTSGRLASSWKPKPERSKGVIVS
jgi:hypothetical protein